MTALYMDGFNHYGAGNTGILNMLDGSWAQGQNNASSGPGVPTWGARTGQYSLGGNITTTPYRLVIAQGAQTKIYLSFGFSVGALPTINNETAMVSFCTSGNSIFANLFCQADGSVALYSGTGSLLAETQGPIIVPSNWHFIEMDFDPTGGNFVLRIDDAAGSGTPLINASGLSFASATVGQLQFLNTSGQNNVWLADLFLRNGAGSVNNGFLGDRRVATLFVNVDDPAINGWSPNYYHQLGAGILNVQGLHNSNEPVVHVPTNTNLNIGSADFTLEGFVRFAALPVGSSTKSTIWSRWDEALNQRSYQLFLGSTALNGGALCWQTSTDGTNGTVAQPIVYPFTPDTDTWYHVAMVRAAGELLLFVNGIQLGLPIADSRTYFAGTGQLSLGGEVTGAGFFTTEIPNTYLDGWLDEVRFTNGVGRYTTNFTPPTVEFPRSSSDPDWNDVVLLAGFDTLLQDESQYAQSMISLNGAFQQTVNDGPLVGVHSTMNKPVPDDFTFAEASFTSASSILTLNAQPANGDTVTVGTQNGSTPAVYTFQTSLGSSYGDVLIDTSLQQTLANLFNAINAGPGSGTKYGSSTTSNHDVGAEQLPAGQMEVTALTPGTSGNSIASTSSLTHGGGWTGSTLSGGANIPGPSAFQVQTLPPDTTIISAVQITSRSFKSDAGVGTFNTAFIGPLGTVDTGPTHSLTVSPVYYNDIFETDPDNGDPISPTTVINGKVEINRDT